MADSQEALSFFRSIIEEFHEKDVVNFISIFTPGVEVFEGIPDDELVNLQVVEENLNDDLYANDYWLFIRDVNLSLNMLADFYGKKSKTHKKALELKNMFDEKMDVFMKDRGYCCGRYYISLAKEFTCSSSTKENECLLKHMETFYRYQSYTFCEHHFEEKFGDEFEVYLNDQTPVEREDFEKYVFKEKLAEEMVECCACLKEFHERCVHHLNENMIRFYCKNCRHNEDFRFDPLSPKIIPKTKCDKFITKHVAEHLKEIDAPLVLRMLSSVKTSFETNFKLQQAGISPPEIEYTNATIFAFLADPEGYYTCFFTLFVQLYGEDAPAPNQKSAYISFVDSVKIYSGTNRTELYHLIILGLLEYLKKLGYEKIFIWSCPPEENVDYVFPFKPSNQKMPNSDILNKWYESMIEKGKKLNTIGEVEQVESYALRLEWKDIQNVPIFSGDIWVSKLLEVIAIVEKEQHEMEGKIRASGKSMDINKNARIWELLKVQTQDFNENYFIVTLKQDSQVPNHSIDLQTVDRQWINNRHILFDFFGDLKLMFKDLRQCRFATYILLYRILMCNGICRNCSKKAALDPYLLCDDCSEKAINLQESLENNPTNKRQKFN